MNPSQRMAIIFVGDAVVDAGIANLGLKSFYMFRNLQLTLIFPVVVPKFLSLVVLKSNWDGEFSAPKT